MRPNLLPRLALVALALLPLKTLADPIAYAVGFSDLYRLNLSTGQATRVGPIGFNDVEGLAMAPNGILYGAVDGTAGAGSTLTDFLIRIDPATGQGTGIGQLAGLQGMGPNGQLDYGLAATCDGRLWLASETTMELWEVDRNNGGTRRVGATGATISGLAARGNTLYGVSVSPNPSLYRIDINTAQATLVGALDVGGTVNNAGLDFDAEGNLWAVLDPNDVVPSRVARVDLTTGRGTVIANINANIGFKGLAVVAASACQPGAAAAPTVPVPGPGLPALLLMVLAGGFLARRHLREQGQDRNNQD